MNYMLYITHPYIVIRLVVFPQPSLDQNISHRGMYRFKMKFTIDKDSIREDTIPSRWYYELYIMHHDVVMRRTRGRR